MQRQRLSRMCFFLVPAVVWIGWLSVMTEGNRWHLLGECWFMTLTMCVGSFIAGATSEGGGAVAFPVMTLLFNISPPVARDFSLLIQSVGMTAASVLICLLRVRVEWRAIALAGIGGVCGVIIGLEHVAPLFPAAYTKMFFTSLWLSFAVALYWINRDRGRLVHARITELGPWQSLMLVLVGVAGGVVSGVTGSGLDMMTFTLLTLYFRVSEKVATPTSVVLMAGNAVTGAIWAGLIQQRLAAEAWDYWYACVPVVVVGAPLGAYFIRARTRRFIASFLCVCIAIQFLGALVIVPQSLQLLWFSTCTLMVGLFSFRQMALAGARQFAPLSAQIAAVGATDSANP